MVYRVFSCGSNGKYQLGTGSDEDLEQLQFVFETVVPVRRIACGGNHTLLLLQNGELYAAGDNSEGQCGIGDAVSVPNFTRVNERLWKDCSAGYEYSVLVSPDDEIYTVGFGPKGELGIGEKITRSITLTRVAFQPNSPIVEVRSCLDHNIVRLDNGQLYGWGNGRSSKIGEPAESKVWIPRLISLDYDVCSVDLGRDFTVVSDGTRLNILGKDKYGIVDQINVEADYFKTMWSSLHIVNKQGQITSMGNNSHGQMIPQSQIGFRMFDVGSEHGIIVQGNKVICWGWGEHGNCGTKKDGSVTFDYFNELKDFAEDLVVMIKGGCATTWVVTQP